MPSPRFVRHRLECRFYRRPFAQPLVTAHGIWQVREGVIVRLTAPDGRAGFGEAAPVPHFSIETTANDVEWLRAAGGYLTPLVLARVPLHLPCLRWALDCARAMLEGKLHLPTRTKPLAVAALLPAGAAAIEALKENAAAAYHVFKWKIATIPPAEELALLESLLAALPPGGKLRLDANGGLSESDYAVWCEGLQALGKKAAAVEFLEQPWPATNSLKVLRKWARAAAPVAVALDESVCSLSALRRAAAARWPGPLVVKPSLLGDFPGFVRWRERVGTDLVYSSAFETSVGLHAALCLAATDPHAGRRALGFGTLAAFANDGLQLPAHPPGPNLKPSHLTIDDFSDLWNRLQ